MPLNVPPLTCQQEPFLYQSTPQATAEEGASGARINEGAVEDYLNRLREALCSDLTQITAEIQSILERVEALE